MEAPAFPMDANWDNIKEYLDKIIRIFNDSEKALLEKWTAIFSSEVCGEHVEEVNTNCEDEIQFKFMLQSMRNSVRTFEYFFELQNSANRSEQRLCDCSMEYLLQKNILQVFVCVLTYLNHFKLFSDEKIFKTFIEIYKSLLILGKLSDKFTTCMATHSQLKYLIFEQICLCRVLHGDTDECDKTPLQRKRIKKLIKESLRLALHILLKSGDLAFFMESLSWTLVIQEILLSEQFQEDSLIAQVTLILLVNATKDNRESCQNTFSAHLSQKLLSELVNLIQISLEDERHTLNEFSTENYLSMLVAVSNDNSMKLKLWREEGSMSLLKQIIKEVNYPEEATLSSQIICSMLLHPEILHGDKTAEHKSLVVYFNEIKDAPHCEEVKESISTALWLLHRDTLNLPIESDKGSTAHSVFISYCSEDSEVVHSVWKRLNSSGISCWIDVKQMKGSIINAMAEGIEKARVFLLCMSPAYQRSYWCEMEARFAVISRSLIIIPLVVHLRFKPQGWLKFIASDKTYYEFSERRDFEKTLAELIAVIQTALK